MTYIWFFATVLSLMDIEMSLLVEALATRHSFPLFALVTLLVLGEYGQFYVCFGLSVCGLGFT